MAARKVNRAPPPPTLRLQQQQQQQQESQFEAGKMVSVVSFGGEEAAEASWRNGRQSPQQRDGMWNGHHQPVSIGVTDPHESEQQQQQQQQQQQRLKRISYIPHKSTAPPPPPPQAHLQAQSSPSSCSVSDQKPHQLPADAELAAPSAQPRVVVHQTVYTRPKDMDLMMNPAAAGGSNRLINPFAPSSQRPMSQPPMSRSSRASSAGNLSTASWNSTGSRKSNGDSGSGGGGGQTLKGRLANLFRRKNRKYEQPLPQEQLKEQQQPQGQQPDRLRRHSCAPQSQTPQPPLTRKNLHTFTYTDAKIYNPNNANVYIAPPVRGAGGARKGLAPQPPLAALAADEAAAADKAAAADADAADDAGRTQVWWDMRTMGAMHSNYNADVLLVRNPDLAPDYETATTRF